MHCQKCHKPSSLCVCGLIKTIPVRTQVVILQHPQEKKEILASAEFVRQLLPHCTLKVGLSWPSLRSVLGLDRDAPLNHKDWLVLYLGAKKLATDFSPGLTIVDAKNRARPNSAQLLSQITGLIVLDGNWAQVKSMWWRNSWLLKTQRAVLKPVKRSVYGKLRREPRLESLSTLEAVALSLSIIENDPVIFEEMCKPFIKFLEHVRNTSQASRQQSERS